MTMAKNTGEGYRRGEVKQRSQVQSPRSGDWVRRDTETAVHLRAEICLYSERAWSSSMTPSDR